MKILALARSGLDSGVKQNHAQLVELAHDLMSTSLLETRRSTQQALRLPVLAHEQETAHGQIKIRAGTRGGLLRVFGGVLSLTDDADAA